MFALGAIFLPTEWMKTLHGKLGLGEFPESQITEYLTRSISAVYALHGTMTFAFSFYLRKVWSLVPAICGMHIAFGAIMLGVDLAAKLPAYWTYLEGPGIVAFGLLILSMYFQANGRGAFSRGTLMLVLVIAAAIAWQLFNAYFSLKDLAAAEESVRQFVQQNLLIALLIAFFVYIIVTGFSVPGAVPLSLTCAIIFGFWLALLVVSFASTIGATLAFLASRYLFRESIENRFGERLQIVNSALESEGWFYLFSMRLIPYIPFFAINALMGLTRIKTRTFYWVSQLGMLPGTCAILYLGSQVPSLNELSERGWKSVLKWELLLALAILGILPLLLKPTVSWFRNRMQNREVIQH